MFKSMEAPAVFVRKKTGDIRICVDYHGTVKDMYPLPRPDEVQDRVSGSVILFHSGLTDYCKMSTASSHIQLFNIFVIGFQ